VKDRGNRWELETEGKGVGRKSSDTRGVALKAFYYREARALAPERRRD
jgi:hypothetical protein